MDDALARTGAVRGQRCALPTARPFAHMPMHGRPRLAKRSIHDGSKVEIAAMHPDFDVRHHAWLSLMESADPSPYHSHALRVLGHVRVGSVTV